MKVFSVRFRLLFWCFAVVVALAALGIQALSTHRDNLRLRNRIRRWDAKILRRTTENRNLGEEKSALENDPYRIEREMRNSPFLGDGEKFLPRGTK